LGLLSFDGDGNFSGNVTTTPGPTSGPVSGTYSINSNGTGTALVQTGPNPPFDRLGNGSPYTWVLLLNDRCGQLANFQDHQNLGDNEFNPGTLLKRTASAFAISSLNGNYVAVESGLNKVVLALIHFDGAGNITVNASQDGTGFGIGSGESITGTYSVHPDGTGQIQFSDPQGGFVDRQFPWQFILQDAGNSAVFIDPDQNVYVGGELYPTVGDYGTLRKQN
jgi:hypothetical protein